MKISKAVSEKRLISIDYKRITDNEEVDYIVKPIRILLSGFNWIMHAVKEGESLIKIFYLTRIKSIKILDHSFKLDTGIKESNERVKIKLKFSKSVKNQLVDKVWFQEFELTEDKEGNVVLETEQEITNYLAGWCVSWWDAIEIIEPKLLKDHISEMNDSFAKKIFKL